MAIPVEIVSSGFDFTAFLIGAAQTAIGSFAGFLFGLWTVHIQRKQEAKTQSDETNQTLVDALQRLAVCAHQNLETLGMLRAGQLATLTPELPVMKQAYEEAFAGGPIANLLTKSQQMMHFYESIAQMYRMHAPSFDELSGASKEMPGLLVFLFRSMSFFDEVNERIRNRNSLIAEHSRENGVGLTTERVIYFAGMLGDEGRNIAEYATLSMACFHLVYEQTEKYLVHVAKVPVVCPPMLPITASVLPPTNTLPAMRALLRTFE